MEKDKNNYKGVIALLIAIIVILSTLCILFATGIISFKSNDIEIPKTLGGEDKEKNSKKEDIKFDADDFALPPLKNFGKEDFNFDDKFLKEDFSVVNDCKMPYCVTEENVHSYRNTSCKAENNRLYFAREVDDYFGYTQNSFGEWEKRFRLISNNNFH